MARGEIRTRWHDWVEAYQRGHLLIPSPSGTLTIHRKAAGYNPEPLADVADGLYTLPHYFISRECMDFVNSTALTKSIAALQRADLEALPHEHSVVEFCDDLQDSKFKTRYFVIVSRRTFPIESREHCYHPHLCKVFMLYEPDYAGAVATRMRDQRALGAPVVVDPETNDIPREWAVAPRATVMIRCIQAGFKDAKGVVVEEDGLHYASFGTPWVDETGNQMEDGRFQEEMVAAAGTAVRCLLGLMRTRGIEQVEVSAPKLNKARVGRGRPAIVDHTVVRLGFYLDSSGRRHAYDASSRVPQVMHYRTAHTKRVWTGPRGSQTAKEVFIEGYVVNYVEGAERPGPKPKVVRPPTVIRADA